MTALEQRLGQLKTLVRMLIAVEVFGVMLAMSAFPALAFDESASLLLMISGVLIAGVFGFSAMGVCKYAIRLIEHEYAQRGENQWKS